MARQGKSDCDGITLVPLRLYSCHRPAWERARRVLQGGAMDGGELWLCVRSGTFTRWAPELHSERGPDVALGAVVRALAYDEVRAL